LLIGAGVAQPQRRLVVVVVLKAVVVVPFDCVPEVDVADEVVVVRSAVVVVVVLTTDVVVVDDADESDDDDESVVGLVSPMITWETGVSSMGAVTVGAVDVVAITTGGRTVVVDGGTVSRGRRLPGSSPPPPDAGPVDGACPGPVWLVRTTVLGRQAPASVAAVTVVATTVPMRRSGRVPFPAIPRAPRLSDSV
jgi:hypothetical protein